MTDCTDSDDSSLQVGPPRHAASPQPTRPPRVSIRTKAKFTACSVVNDILCGRFTGMSAMMTRTSPMVRSLGIRAVVVHFCGAAGEPCGVEEREVGGGLAVNQPRGHVVPGGRRVLEAMAAEADGEEEALD